MAEKPKKNIIWRVFTWLFTVILGLLLMLNLVLGIYTNNISGTLLNPSFIASELGKVGIYSAAKDLLAEKKDELVEELGLGGLGEQGEQIFDIIEASLSEDLLQSELQATLDKFFSYLNGESDDPDLSISLVSLKENFKTSLSQSIHESPPEGLTGLSPQELDTYLEQAYEGIDSLLTEIRVEFSNPQALEQMRNAVEGLKLINYILIAAAVLFALLLILLHFRLKASLRAIGFPVFLAGVAALIISIVGTSLASSMIGGMEFPSPLSAEMATTIVKDSLTASNLFIYALIAVGLALIIISFIYRERRSTAQPQQS